jgi:hypothetical protein
MFNLTPSNAKFYDHFDRASDLLVRTAEQFHDLLGDFRQPRQRADEIKRLEHEADQVAHDAMELLHSSFITPIERSDIRRLVIALDDVVDLIDDATSRLALYEMKEVLPGAARLANILLGASKAVRATVKEVRLLRKKNDLFRLCIEIKHWEAQGDQAYHETVADLFKSGTDPLTVMKWKEVLEDIETALDRCEDVANVVEGIAIESA